MEKKDNQIGRNISSGTEKVETIADMAQAKADGVSGTKSSAAGTGVKATAKKTAAKKGAQSVKAKEKKEKQRAKKRVDAAILKEERKQKKEEAKKARQEAAAEAKRKRKETAQKAKAEREKRREAAAEKAAQRKAEKQARRELLKNETVKEKAARIERERAAKLKMKEAKKERAYQLKLEKQDAKLKQREQRLNEQERKSGRQRTPGFGGWLAAVISLGAVSLVLTSILAYGALNMRTVTSLMGSGYQGTLYELVGIMDDVDEDLNKVRVSASSTEQSRILTDLLVQSRLAESSLEKMPLTMEQDANMTSFINRTASSANRMLEKLRSGGDLSEKDMERLEELYKTNHEMRAVLDDLAYNMSEKDMKAFMKNKGKDKLTEGFKTVENLTTPERVGEKGPFERTIAPDTNERKTTEGLSSGEAEELCKEYFKNYSIKKIEYAGETVARGREAYNFYLCDENDVRLFAEISKSGELLGFDYYKDCSAHNFDTERALAIAEDYLKERGYENMTPVWVSESGAQADFKFVYDDGQAVYYSDAILVKVCEERGIVSGLDATAYIRHHRGRDALNVKISEKEAMQKLHKNLTVENARLAVIPVRGREIAAYEFICSYDGNEYYVYVDAATGEEAQILLVENSAQGRALH